MKIKSGTTQRNIDFDDNIIIVNPKQAAFYWEEKKNTTNTYISNERHKY